MVNDGGDINWKKLGGYEWASIETVRTVSCHLPTLRFIISAWCWGSTQGNRGNKQRIHCGMRTYGKNSTERIEFAHEEHRCVTLNNGCSLLLRFLWTELDCGRCPIEVCISFWFRDKLKTLFAPSRYHRWINARFSIYTFVSRQFVWTEVRF